MQDVAFADDHVIVAALPNCTAVGLAAMATTGAGGAGAAGGSSPPLWQPDNAASAPSVQNIARRFTIWIATPTLCAPAERARVLAN